MAYLEVIQVIAWIATAASVCIGAIYYVFTARLTLQTRQAQLFMQLYGHYYDKGY